MSAATLSEWLGWLSIGSWLGAQFPQVVENYKRQSVDGLALPFLVNWLFGDITNLVGCILTHQLPFQTYLATYFVFVDFSLLSQYIYYNSLKRRSSKLRSHSAHERAESRSHEREASHYRTLSVVAAHVAASAALAAQHEEARSRRSTIDTAHHHHRHSHSVHSVPPQPESIALSHEGSNNISSSTAGQNPSEDDDGDEPSDDALAVLADSFQSDGTAGGRIRRKQVSWSQERYGSASAGPSRGPSTIRGGGTGLGGGGTLSPIMSPDSAEYESAMAAAAARGRSRAHPGTADDTVAHSPTHTQRERKSSRASKRGATLVFLSAWTLFGVGTMTIARVRKGLPQSMIPNSGVGTGRVLADRGVALSLPTAGTVDHAVDRTWQGQSGHSSAYVHVPATQDALSATTTTTTLEPPSTERIVGRISAWICTTLYLTSRLPQIWKNFVRKSVEGLSIALFVFAFLGNAFYVASILTSPSMQGRPEDAIAFVQESLPYLLGSGGTLVFDVTIVCQSMLYRKRPGVRPRGRARSASTRTIQEEEAGLLDPEQGDQTVHA